MNNEQIKALAESVFARTALMVLLEVPENVVLLEKLATVDVAFARFCERNKIWTPSRWRELTRG